MSTARVPHDFVNRCFALGMAEDGRLNKERERDRNEEILD